MKKILVTGADGFIGSHLVEALVSDDFSVKALTQYNSFGTWGWLDTIDKNILKEIEIVSGDIRDPYFVNDIAVNCNYIFHLAALIAIPYSYLAPYQYIETNITGTCNILQSALKNNIDRVIHTSTSEVYGTAQFVPITEEHPLSGQSPYSASKIGADHLAMSFYNSYDLPLTTIRPFNTYGPRQSARAVIPSIIIQLLDKETISLGDLSPTRDFNYVSDTVSGFVSTIDAEESIGETINIGSNFEVSINDTAKLIADIMNVPIDIIQDKERFRPEKSEVERLFSSNDKAKEMLNWSPKYAGKDGFKKGLEETIDWFSIVENRALYKNEIYNK